MTSKYFVTMMLIGIVNILHAQNYCFEGASGSFKPIQAGLKVKYVSGGESYRSYFPGDSVEINGKYFLKEVKAYVNGKTKLTYWRQENGAVYSYDMDKKMESLELSSNLSMGHSWESADKTVRYTIIDTTSSFASPMCEFTSLLQLKVEPTERNSSSNQTYYNLFYKRGVGLVGLNVNDKPYTFAVTSEPLNERNIIAYGCEKLATEEERERCTNEKISKFFKKEFRIPARKDLKKGTLVFLVGVDKTGLVEKVEVIQSVDGAGVQEQEVIKVLMRLPKMIPAQIHDGYPTKSSFGFPVKF